MFALVQETKDRRIHSHYVPPHNTVIQWYICTCILTVTHTHTQAYVHGPDPTCTHAPHICMNTCTYTYVYIYTHTHLSILYLYIAKWNDIRIGHCVDTLYVICWKYGWKWHILNKPAEVEHCYWVVTEVRVPTKYLAIAYQDFRPGGGGWGGGGREKDEGRGSICSRCYFRLLG